jgi:hypothetical protein
MFQEFVNRSGLDPSGLGGVALAVARHVPEMGRHSPRALLPCTRGRSPHHHVQKTMLASTLTPHPPHHPPHRR